MTHFRSRAARIRLRAAFLALGLGALTNSPSAFSQTVSGQWALHPDGFTADLRFGRSVAVSGDLIAVGATGDRTNGPKSGAVYVFERSGGEWLRTKLLAPDAEPGARFGWKVAVDDGRIAISAPWASNSVADRSGKIYVYERTNDAWDHQVLRISDSSVVGQIGRGLAMAGSRVAVGAPFDNNANGDKAGSLIVFEETPAGWSSRTLVPAEGAPDGWFGMTVAADERRIAAGGYSSRRASGAEAGTASMFELTGANTWTEQALANRVQPEAGDHFGRALVIDGERVFVGAEEDDNTNGINAGAVFELRLDDRDAQPRLFIPADGSARSYLGFSVATTTRYLAASEDTEVRLFELGGSDITQGKKLSMLLGKPLPGGVLSLAGDGSRLVAGMPFADTAEENAGAVLVVSFAR